MQTYFHSGSFLFDLDLYFQFVTLQTMWISKSSIYFLCLYLTTEYSGVSFSVSHIASGTCVSSIQSIM